MLRRSFEDFVFVWNYFMISTLGLTHGLFLSEYGSSIFKGKRGGWNHPCVGAAYSVRKYIYWWRNCSWVLSLARDWDQELSASHGIRRVIPYLGCGDAQMFTNNLTNKEKLICTRRSHKGPSWFCATFHAVCWWRISQKWFRKCSLNVPNL